MKIDVEDIQGIVGIVPTPATADAEKWQTNSSVDLEETGRMTRLVVEAGIDVLMCAGTFGECATLTEPELADFTRAIAEANAKARPFFAGITTLNTRDTVRRGRDLIDAGADGLFIGRPMWLAMSDKDILRFYRDIAEALPGVPVVVYDNPVAFKGKISGDVYDELAKIPEMVAAKHVGGPALAEDMARVGNDLRILPLATAWLSAAKVHPDLGKACWSGSVACAPAPHVALARAILSGDLEAAEAISSKLVWAEQPMFSGGDLASFMDFSIPIAHLRHKAAGLIEPGPTRPPYIDIPASYSQGALETGRRWAQLQSEFSADYQISAAK